MSLILTIDGPAAAGKSTTAKLVARALGARHIDSGALYRAATAARLRGGGDPSSWAEADVLSAAAHVSLEPVDGGFVPQLDDRNADVELRSAAVTAAVTSVAQMPGVRAWANACIREAAVGRDIVVDGRDMGTAVFPDADLKVYLLADSWERARRRLLQRTPGHAPPDAEIAAEVSRLAERDARDSAHSVAAADAVHIDTTGLTQEAQVARIVALAEQRRGRA